MTAKERKQTLSPEGPEVPSAATLSSWIPLNLDHSTGSGDPALPGAGCRTQTSCVQEACTDLETTREEQQAAIFQQLSALSVGSCIGLTRSLVLWKLHLQ